MAGDWNRREFLGMSGASMLSGATGLTGALGRQSGPGFSMQQAEGDKATHTEVPSAAGLGSSLKTRPNIVLFMPDEMRADSVACYGNAVTKTPNFDRLASEGARFSNCHVQYPVCGASRCSMLTGWPTSVRGHRSLYYFLRPEEPNLFRYLREAGYDVYWFGKNDALAAQSFPDSVTEWKPMGYGDGGARPHSLTPGAYSFLYSAGGDRRKTGGYRSVQHAIEVLERKETDRPFCIFLPLIKPHPPYTCPADFYDMYSASEVPAPIPAGLPRKPTYHAGIREYYNLGHLGESTYRKIKAVYYGSVSYSDWLLGEVMAAMERTGRDKDTALFVLSDHGDYTGDYGLVEKWPSGLEDVLTHVPLIGRVPGGKAGVVSDEMVELYDVMATCLDVAGTEARHTHFARSLVPQLKGQKGDAGRAAFSEGGYNVYEPQCFEPTGSGGGPYVKKVALQNERPQTISRSTMIRTRTHKLVVRPQGQSELYNCVDDPEERYNLYGEHGAAALQAELQGRLLEHFINTTGIAPYDKDQRGFPAFYPTNWGLEQPGWQEKILDKG